MQNKNPLKHFKKNQINKSSEVNQAHKIKQQIQESTPCEYTIFHGDPEIYQNNIKYLEQNNIKVQECCTGQITTEIGIAWTQDGEDKMVSKMQDSVSRHNSSETTSLRSSEEVSSLTHEKFSGENRYKKNKSLKIRSGSGTPRNSCDDFSTEFRPLRSYSSDFLLKTLKSRASDNKAQNNEKVSTQRYSDESVQGYISRIETPIYLNENFSDSNISFLQSNMQIHDETGIPNCLTQRKIYRETEK